MRVKSSGWLVTINELYRNTAKGKDWETMRHLVSRHYGRTLVEALAVAKKEVKHNGKNVNKHTRAPTRPRR